MFQQNNTTTRWTQILSFVYSQNVTFFWPRNRQIADEEAMFLAKPHLEIAGLRVQQIADAPGSKRGSVLVNHIFTTEVYRRSQAIIDCRITFN